MSTTTTTTTTTTAAAAAPAPATATTTTLKAEERSDIKIDNAGDDPVSASSSASAAAAAATTAQKGVAKTGTMSVPVLGGAPDETVEVAVGADGVYDEVEIEDMTYDEDADTYYYPCPCGDRFAITGDELADGEEIATCPSCSLIILVVYDPDDFVSESEGEEEEEGEE